MQKLKIRQGDWVVVCDGRKALVLENAGDEKFLNLRTREVYEHPDPKTHELGTDAVNCQSRCLSLPRYRYAAFAGCFSSLSTLPDRIASPSLPSVRSSLTKSRTAARSRISCG